MADEVSSIGVRLSLNATDFMAGMTAATAATTDFVAASKDAQTVAGGSGSGRKTTPGRSHAQDIGSVNVDLTVSASTITKLRKQIIAGLGAIPITITPQMAKSVGSQAEAVVAAQVTPVVGTRSGAAHAVRSNVKQNLPSRAYGGPVYPGQDFLVGERRAEVVRFSGSGSIHPDAARYYREQEQQARREVTEYRLHQERMHRMTGGPTKPMGPLQRRIAGLPPIEPERPAPPPPKPVEPAWIRWTRENRQAKDLTGHAGGGRVRPSRSLEARAIREFGLARQVSEAGWLTPSGRMLDFSGRHYAQGYHREGNYNVPDRGEWDYLQGQRNVDHRETNSPLGLPSGWTGLQRLMKRGFIRLATNGYPSQFGGEMWRMPTEAQMRVLAQYGRNAQYIGFDVARKDAADTITSGGGMFGGVGMGRHLAAIRDFYANRMAGGPIRANKGHLDISAIDPNLRQMFAAATPTQRAEGAEWYAKWGKELRAEAAKLHLDPKLLTSVAATLSPNNGWPGNFHDAVKYARAWSQGLPMPGASTFGVNQRKAWDILQHQSPHFLKGLKVQPFGAALLGDPNAKPQDIWMKRAAVGDLSLSRTRGTPSVRQRREMDRVIDAIAVEQGLEPRQVQAIIWTAAREQGMAATGARKHHRLRQAGGFVGSLFHALGRGTGFLNETMGTAAGWAKDPFLAYMSWQGSQQHARRGAVTDLPAKPSLRFGRDFAGSPMPYVTPDYYWQQQGPRGMHEPEWRRAMTASPYEAMQAFARQNMKSYGPEMLASPRPAIWWSMGKDDLAGLGFYETMGRIMEPKRHQKGGGTRTWLKGNEPITYESMQRMKFRRQRGSLGTVTLPDGTKKTVSGGERLLYDSIAKARKATPGGDPEALAAAQLEIDKYHAALELGTTVERLPTAKVAEIEGTTPEPGRRHTYGSLYAAGTTVHSRDGEWLPSGAEKQQHTGQRRMMFMGGSEFGLFRTKRTAFDSGWEIRHRPVGPDRIATGEWETISHPLSEKIGLAMGPSELGIALAQRPATQAQATAEGLSYREHLEREFGKARILDDLNVGTKLTEADAAEHMAMVRESSRAHDVQPEKVNAQEAKAARSAFGGLPPFPHFAKADEARKAEIMARTGGDPDKLIDEVILLNGFDPSRWKGKAEGWEGSYGAGMGWGWKGGGKFQFEIYGVKKALTEKQYQARWDALRERREAGEVEAKRAEWEEIARRKKGDTIDYNDLRRKEATAGISEEVRKKIGQGQPTVPQHEAPEVIAHAKIAEAGLERREERVLAQRQAEREAYLAKVAETPTTTGGYPKSAIELFEEMLATGHRERSERKRHADAVRKAESLGLFTVSRRTRAAGGGVGEGLYIVNEAGPEAFLTARDAAKLGQVRPDIMARVPGASDGLRTGMIQKPAWSLFAPQQSGLIVRREDAHAALHAVRAQGGANIPYDQMRAGNGEPLTILRQGSRSPEMETFAANIRSAGEAAVALRKGLSGLLAAVPQPKQIGPGTAGNMIYAGPEGYGTQYGPYPFQGPQAIRMGPGSIPAGRAAYFSGPQSTATGPTMFAGPGGVSMTAPSSMMLAAGPLTADSQARVREANFARARERNAQQQAQRGPTTARPGQTVMTSDQYREMLEQGIEAPAKLSPEEQAALRFGYVKAGHERARAGGPKSAEEVLGDVRLGTAGSAAWMSARTPRGVAAVYGEMFGGGAEFKRKQATLQQETLVYRRLGNVYDSANTKVEAYTASIEEAKRVGTDYSGLQTQLNDHLETRRIAEKNLTEQSEKLVAAEEAVMPTTGGIIKSFGSIILATSAYGAAFSMANMVLEKALLPAMGKLGDQFLGFAPTMTRFTSALADSTREMGGNYKAALAAKGMTAGLSSETYAWAESAMGATTIAKAGAKSYADFSEIIRASIGALNQQGMPQGLGGGYGGILGSPLFAEQMGGGKGLQEQMLGDILAARGQTGIDWGKYLTMFGAGFGIGTVGGGGVNVGTGLLAGGAAAGASVVTDIATGNFGNATGPLPARIEPGSAEAVLSASLDAAMGRAQARTGGPQYRFAYQGRDVSAEYANAPKSMQNLAKSGYAVVDSSGKIVTAFDKVVTASEQLAKGLTIPDVATWAETVERQINVQFQAMDIASVVNRTITIPLGFAMQRIASPLLAPAAGAVPGAGMEEVYGRHPDWEKILGIPAMKPSEYAGFFGAAPTTTFGKGGQVTFGGGMGLSPEMSKLLGQWATDAEASQKRLAESDIAARKKASAMIMGQPDAAATLAAAAEKLPTTTSATMPKYTYVGGTDVRGFNPPHAPGPTPAPGPAPTLPALPTPGSPELQAQLPTPPPFIGPPAPPGLQNTRDYNALMDAAQTASNQLKDLQTSIASLSAEAAKASWANTTRLALRSISDAAGMLGQAGGSALGKLQRHLWQIGRAGQALDLQLQQRQITTQMALAQFQAPGETGEERYMRQKERLLEASIAQRKLGYAKETFTGTGEEWKIQAKRNLEDAQAAWAAAQKAHTAEMAAADAQATIAALSAEIASDLGQADDIYQTAAGKFGIANSALADYAKTFGGTIKAANASLTGLGTTLEQSASGVRTFLEALGFSFSQNRDKSWNVTPPNLSAPAEPPHARGIIGLAKGQTQAIMGEAGDEAVAILRNPRASSFGSTQPWGGGGGGVTININGPVVRQDQDITALAQAVAGEVERALSRKGQLLGLRSPAY